ncbi:MAG: hypothetical protein IJ659_03425 [Alloprevotella sp.]|nr:hypothetical protein [Alloprevotella sp.]
MKKILFIFLLFTTTLTWGAPNNAKELVRLQQEVSNLKSTVSKLQQEDRRLNDLYQQQKKELDSLYAQQQQQAEKVSVLDEKAAKAGVDISEANQKIDNSVSSLSESISSRTLLGASAILIALGLLACTYYILYILRRKISNGATTIDMIRSAQEGLETAQKAMQEESVKLDSKLVELLDKKIEAVPTPTTNEQADHTLALKVADEIVRIETNLSRMDTSVKGYKQLAKAVERIRTNFLANGYEIVEMLGKPYNEGMKVVANFVSDDTLAEGEQKITGIIKPQINYKGKMIQSAQITVSQNL